MHLFFLCFFFVVHSRENFEFDDTTSKSFEVIDKGSFICETIRTLEKVL